MKARFGRREPKDIDPGEDYLMDNGLCVQLITLDPNKKIFRDSRSIESFRFSRKHFDSLLKRNLVYFTRLKGMCKCYFFRSSVKEIDEVV
jgi:hypothetical protein